MTNHFVFRRYRDADRESVFTLYEAVYGKRKGHHWRQGWDWEYRQNPHNPGSESVWVAEGAGRIVGLACGIPVMVRWRGETVRACWFLDLMTLPAWRGRGIFRELTELMIEEAVRDSISIFLSFPNDQSGPLLRRRGWPDITILPGMIKGLRFLPLLRKPSLRRISRVIAGVPLFARQLMGRSSIPEGADGATDLEIREIDSFDDRFDLLFEEASGTCDFIVVRDARYLNWRYVECPHRAYTILLAEEGSDLLGYIVLAVGRRPGGKGYIVDFLTKPGGRGKDAAALLVHHAVLGLRKAGAASVELCAMGEPYNRVLESQGFSIMPTDAFRGYSMVGRIEGDSVGARDFADIRRWFITRGDADSDIATDF